MTDLTDVISRIKLSPQDQRRKIVHIDVPAFDRAWSKDHSFYVGPGGTVSAIKGRYERFLRYMESGAEIYAPSVHVSEEGVVGFTDGRHRFAVLRDLGAKVLPVAMNAMEARRARRFGLLASQKTNESRLIEETDPGTPDQQKIIEVNPDEKEFTIPLAGLSYIEREIEQLNKRAKRLKLDPMEIVRIKTSKKTITRKDPTTNKREDVEIDMVTIRIVGQPPKLPGWQLISRLDWREGNPMIYEVPKMKTPISFRSSGQHCEHCKKNSKRMDTFVLQNTETNQYVQVGRNCLADFLGHADSARKVVNTMEFYQTIEDWLKELAGGGVFSDEDWEEFMQGGASAKLELSSRLIDFLSIVMKAAGDFGYKYASDREKSTASYVMGSLAIANGPAYTARDQAEREKVIEYLKSVTDEHRAMARKAIEMVANKAKEQGDKASTYLYNLNQIVQGGEDTPINAKKAGLAASIYIFYMKEKEKEDQDRAKNDVKNAPANLQYVGEVGSRSVLKIKLKRVPASFDTDYGTMFIMPFEDENGNQLVWKTSSPFQAEPGEWFEVKATIKGHKEYKGTKQTELSRVAVVKELTDAPKAAENVTEVLRPVPAIDSDPIGDLRKHLKKRTKAIDLRFWEWVIPVWAEANGEFKDSPKDEDGMPEVTLDDLNETQKRSLSRYIHQHQNDFEQIDWQPNWVMEFVREVKPTEELYHFTTPTNAKAIVESGFKRGAGLYNLTCTKEKHDVDNGNGPYAFAFLRENANEHAADIFGNAIVAFRSDSAIVVNHPMDTVVSKQVIFNKDKVHDLRLVEKMTDVVLKPQQSIKRGYKAVFADGSAIMDRTMQYSMDKDGITEASADSPGLWFTTDLDEAKRYARGHSEYPGEVVVIAVETIGPYKQDSRGKKTTFIAEKLRTLGVLDFMDDESLDEGNRMQNTLLRYLRNGDEEALNDLIMLDPLTRIDAPPKKPEYSERDLEDMIPQWTDGQEEFSYLGDEPTLDDLKPEHKEDFMAWVDTSAEEEHSLAMEKWKEEHPGFQENEEVYGNPFSEISDDTWLIHLTQDAMSIARDGFVSGASAQFLGRTAAQHYRDTSRGLFAFGFQADSSEAEEAVLQQSYGDQIVFFKAQSAIEAFHSGDQERQVIFDRRHTSDRVAVIPKKNGKGPMTYDVLNPDEEKVFSGTYEEIVEWFEKSYAAVKHEVGQSGYTEASIIDEGVDNNASVTDEGKSFAERIRSEVKMRFPNVDFWMSSASPSDVVVLSRIVLPKKERGAGIGTKVMEFIVSEADKAGMTIALSPSIDFGGSSKSRLEGFYRRFGFTSNRGRPKNFRVSESMIRVPKVVNDKVVEVSGTSLVEVAQNLAVAIQDGCIDESSTVHINTEDGSTSLIGEAIFRLVEKTIGEPVYAISIKGDPIVVLKAHLKQGDKIDLRFWERLIPAWADDNNLFQDRPKGQVTDRPLVRLRDLDADQRDDFMRYVKDHGKDVDILSRQPSWVMKYVRDIKPSERIYHYTSKKNARSIARSGFNTGASLFTITGTREKFDPSHGRGRYVFGSLKPNDQALRDEFGDTVVSFRCSSAILVDYPQDTGIEEQVICDRKAIQDIRIEEPQVVESFRVGSWNTRDQDFTLYFDGKPWQYRWTTDDDRSEIMARLRNMSNEEKILAFISRYAEPVNQVVAPRPISFRLNKGQRLCPQCQTPIGLSDIKCVNCDHEMDRIDERTNDDAGFKAWFGKSKVVDSSGKPLMVLHGTPDARFTKFSQGGRKNTENQLSHLGFWFTSDPEIAEEFTKKLIHYPIGDPDQVEGDAPGIIPVYLSLQNPKIYESKPKEERDEETKQLKKTYEELEAKIKLVPNWIKRAQMPKEEKERYEQSLEQMYRQQREIEYRIRILRSDDPLEQLMDDRDEFAQWISGAKGIRGAWRDRYMETGNKELTTKQLRDKLIEQGYDGVILKGTIYDSPSKKSGDQFIAFHPNQIKSALAAKKFDPKSDDFTEASKTPSPKTVMDRDEMSDWILDNNLRNGFGKLDYNDAREISGASDSWSLQDINVSELDGDASFSPRRGRRRLPIIVIQVGDHEYEILDGRHRAAEARYSGDKTIQAWVGKPFAV